MPKHVLWSPKCLCPEANANNKDFNKAFKGKEKTETRAKLETEWDATAKANYSKAKELALKAMEIIIKIPIFQIFACSLSAVRREGGQLESMKFLPFNTGVLGCL